MAVRRSLLSGRSQLRLAELHRGVATSLQALNQHHGLLVGALMGCDGPTQQSMLEEHRRHVMTAVEALGRLGQFLERCHIETAVADMSEGKSSSDPDAPAFG